MKDGTVMFVSPDQALMDIARALEVRINDQKERT